MCPGVKIAKFEIKIILALFMYHYEYRLVDSSGKPAKQLPQVDRNDIHNVWHLALSRCLSHPQSLVNVQKRPKGELCFLQYRKVTE
jgi:hypothetical protein